MIYPRYDVIGVDVTECLKIKPGCIWMLQTVERGVIGSERAMITASADLLDRIRLDFWDMTQEAIHWGEFLFSVNGIGITYYGSRIDFEPRSRLENTFLISEGIPVLNFSSPNNLNSGCSKFLTAFGSQQKFGYEAGVILCRNGAFGAYWCIPANISLTLLGTPSKGLSAVMINNIYWTVTHTY